MIAAGVLTWNPIQTERLALLEETVASLEPADQIVVFNNGSTDGFKAAAHDWPVKVETVDIPRLPGFPPGNTCGYGMNKIAATLQADIVVMSNDDILWHDDAIPTLRAVWKDAPDELVIVSGLVEPTFALPDTEPWNQPLGTFEVAGHRLLSRRSVPGGAWTYREPKQIFPVSTFPGVDDVPACHQLVAQGRLVACLDLAEHAGSVSTWGNASHDKFVHTPLQQVRDEFGI